MITQVKVANLKSRMTNPTVAKHILQKQLTKHIN